MAAMNKLHLGWISGVDTAPPPALPAELLPEGLSSHTAIIAQKSPTLFVFLLTPTTSARVAKSIKAGYRMSEYLKDWGKLSTAEKSSRADPVEVIMVDLAGSSRYGRHQLQVTLLTGG